jgi:hypothetical protein
MLQVLQQSFYFQQRIKAVGVTHTRQGITTQQLLLGTISDQVGGRANLQLGASPSCARNQRLLCESALRCLCPAWQGHSNTQ